MVRILKLLKPYKNLTINFYNNIFKSLYSYDYIINNIDILNDIELYLTTYNIDYNIKNNFYYYYIAIFIKKEKKDYDIFKKCIYLSAQYNNFKAISMIIKNLNYYNNILLKHKKKYYIIYLKYFLSKINIFYIKKYKSFINRKKDLYDLKIHNCWFDLFDAKKEKFYMYKLDLYITL